MDGIIKKLIVLSVFFLPAIIFAEVVIQEGLPEQTEISNELVDLPVPPKAVNQSQENRSKLEKQLRETEVAISNLSLKIAATKKELDLEKNKINQLIAEENQLNDKLEKQKILLKKQVALSYRIKDKSLLKALLSNDSLTEEEKTNNYIQHLNNAQLTLAEQIKQTLLSIQKTKQDLQSHAATLETLYVNQKKEQTYLAKNLQSRKSLLASF